MSNILVWVYYSQGFEAWQVRKEENFDEKINTRIEEVEDSID